MPRVLLYPLLFTAWVLVISCSKEHRKEQQPTVRTIQSTSFPANTIILDRNSTVTPLEDNLNAPLGQILYYEAISPDSAIVVARSQLYLFVNHKFAKIIAKRGKGPGEYQKLKSFSCNGDSLVIWDQPTKLLYYSLKQDSVIGESFTPSMYDAKSIVYLPNRQLYFSVMQKLENAGNQSAMIFCVSDIHGSNPSIIPIPISPKQLEFPNIQNPFIQPFNSGIKRNGENVIFRFILSPYVVLLNYLKREFTLFKLQVTIKSAEKPSEANDSQIFATSDFVENVFPLANQFAVGVFRPNYQSKRKDMFLQFYSYNGQSLGEIKIDPEHYACQPLAVVNVTESEIEMLGLSRTVDAKHPYSIIKQRYNITK
jgi:hypothetical protein